MSDGKPMVFLGTPDDKALVARLRAQDIALYHEAAAAIERLRRTLQLHAGDVSSLSGELEEWRERALAAEAELFSTRETAQSISQFSDGELLNELHRRAQHFLGDQTKGVTFPLTDAF